MGKDSVRRALYVLFARLLAGPPDAAFYERLRTGGLQDLAAAQRVDLTSDLLDEQDPETSASELRVEHDRLAALVSLRASDYAAGAEDPVVSMSAVLAEHGFELDRDLHLPCDHLAVALGVMGELAGHADAREEEEPHLRARSFFLRHIAPWAQRALTELAAEAQRRYYRGLAAMVSAFLESERRIYQTA
ncbi:MAG: TorD/DmsD family molecular chaperone [Planctomycetota bacterium]|jgi:TorA maturation chaperone TorD